MRPCTHIRRATLDRSRRSVAGCGPRATAPPVRLDGASSDETKTANLQNKRPESKLRRSPLRGTSAPTGAGTAHGAPWTRTGGRRDAPPSAILGGPLATAGASPRHRRREIDRFASAAPDPTKRRRGLRRNRLPTYALRQSAFAEIGAPGRRRCARAPPVAHRAPGRSTRQPPRGGIAAVGDRRTGANPPAIATRRKPDNGLRPFRPSVTQRTEPVPAASGPDGRPRTALLR